MIDTMPNCKKFDFNQCDIYGIINSLDNRLIISINMYYRDGNIILYVSI